MRQKMDSFYSIWDKTFKAAIEQEPETGFTKPSSAAPVRHVLPSCPSWSPCLIKAHSALVLSELKWDCVPKCDSPTCSTIDIKQRGLVICQDHTASEQLEPLLRECDYGQPPTLQVASYFQGLWQPRKEKEEIVK